MRTFLLHSTVCLTAKYCKTIRWYGRAKSSTDCYLMSQEFSNDNLLLIIDYSGIISVIFLYSASGLNKRAVKCTKVKK